MSSENNDFVVIQTALPRKSVVQIHFNKRNVTLAYYNDRFDLHRGDLVYVEGKLEGMLGCVVDVNYNFKIKLSDYKRVIALIDTNIKGKFFMAGAYFITFNSETLPSSKAVTWFKPPLNEDEEYVSGRDETAFLLDDYKSMNFSSAVAERGREYYTDNQVKYLSIDGTHGYAIVEGSTAYEVEFEYSNGEIIGLICSCYRPNNCNHKFSALMQLRDTLDIIKKHYAKEYEETGYFAAVNKDTLFAFAIKDKETGCIMLE